MTQVKIIDIEIDGESPDIALIDAVVTRDQFIGSRALNADVIDEFSNPSGARISKYDIGWWPDPTALWGGRLWTVFNSNNSGKIKVRAHCAWLYETLSLNL